jgi:hypothetical protein
VCASLPTEGPVVDSIDRGTSCAAHIHSPWALWFSANSVVKKWAAQQHDPGRRPDGLLSCMVPPFMIPSATTRPGASEISVMAMIEENPTGQRWARPVHDAAGTSGDKRRQRCLSRFDLSLIGNVALHLDSLTRI